MSHLKTGAAGLCLGLAVALTGCARSETSEKETKLSDCPPAVQQTLRQYAEGGKIERIKKEFEEGKTVYEAKIKTADGKKMEVEVTPDGKVVKLLAEK